QSVVDIVREHWRNYGRNYYSRHDYEEVDETAAQGLVKHLRESLPKLKGMTLGGIVVGKADDFAYEDPVDGSRTTGQGIRILFEDGSRVVYRLSGTGTAGATLRVYIERYERDASRLDLETQAALAPLIGFARSLAEIESRTGRREPTVIT
ncbi:MAG TPA: alpha-D-glucose phosphate-specific phosphoglucomutase, partial [Verrucomicrobiae bacterium]|nr:alpha-D-glucose phosphate-specific phosphoglucomutase [Verrucomicrobiae bacterium]